jgi:hypothetical protein
MNSQAETISKEINDLIPRHYSVETPSRSTADQGLHGYLAHDWQSEPSREDSHRTRHKALSTLAAQTPEINFASLPLRAVLRRARDHEFDISLKGWLDRDFLTRLHHNFVVATHLTDPMTPTPELQPRETVADRAFERSLGRLNYLRTLADGWLGEDSFGSTEFSGREAEALLRRLRNEAPTAPLPVLGLDTDGTIVMSWSGNGLTGSLTVYGDGTYSYFVRRQGKVARAPEARIDEPIEERFKRLLEA